MQNPSNDQISPEPVPADGCLTANKPDIGTHGPDSASSSSIAPATVRPASEDQAEGVMESVGEESLSTSLAIAKAQLNKAGENLKKNMPKEFLGNAIFEIKASADIISLGDNIELALVTMMDQRNVEKSKQSLARSFVTQWARKTIPYIETGLTVANVRYVPVQK
jgi:hypothetical protein